MMKIKFLYKKFKKEVFIKFKIVLKIKTKGR